MTASELRRWLRKRGCRFGDGTRHTIILLGNKRSIMPRHPSAEIKTGTFHRILKDLGLKQEQ